MSSLITNLVACEDILWHSIESQVDNLLIYMVKEQEHEKIHLKRKKAIVAAFSGRARAHLVIRVSPRVPADPDHGPHAAAARGRARARHAPRPRVPVT